MSITRKVTSAGSVTLDDTFLKKLQADLKQNKRARVRVGILGDYAPRDGGKINNAELGMIHEFGISTGYVNHKSRDVWRKRKTSKAETLNIPARSWLRMPCFEKLPPEVKSAKNRVLWGKIILNKGIKAALELLGALALQKIQQAFATGGWGQWAALKPSTIRRKLAKGRSSTGAAAILIDKGELRQSVTAEVVDKI